MMLPGKRLILASLSARIAAALLIRTSFAPDEFWQGPEVAHRMVFGYGHLTWEWAAGLRSYLHPTIYAILFWVLAALKCDTPLLVAKGPQLLHAGFAALSDAFVYKIARLLFGPTVAWWTFVCQLMSWFNAYCLVRTYSSSVEAPLTAMGVYWLLKSITKPMPKKQRILHADPPPWLWMAAAAFSIAMRPSSALFWSCAAVWFLSASPPRSILRLASRGLLAGSFVLASTAAWDRIWYRRWLFVPWNFFAFNLLHGGSALYGSHPWHWNFSCGFPTMLASLLPLLVVGLRQSSAQQRILAKLVFIQLGAYSLSAHKEFRFLLPALQLAMPYCGLGIYVLLGDRPMRRSRMALFLLGLQVPMMLYFNLYHQKAQVDVINDIRQQKFTHLTTDSVLFLAPCHSTPFFSHVHRPLRMRFLDCSPPGWAEAVRGLNHQEFEWLKFPSSAAVSERQQFEADPGRYVEAIFDLNTEQQWPALIVGFSYTMINVSSVLIKRGYEESTHYWNCLFPADGNNECSMSVYHKQRL